MTKSFLKVEKFLLEHCMLRTGVVHEKHEEKCQKMSDYNEKAMENQHSEVQKCILCEQPLSPPFFPLLTWVLTHAESKK